MMSIVEFDAKGISFPVSKTLGIALLKTVRRRRRDASVA